MKRIRRNRKPLEVVVVIRGVTKRYSVRTSNSRIAKLSQPRFITEIKA